MPTDTHNTIENDIKNKRVLLTEISNQRFKFHHLILHTYIQL